MTRLRTNTPTGALSDSRLSGWATESSRLTAAARSVSPRLRDGRAFSAHGFGILCERVLYVCRATSGYFGGRLGMALLEKDLRTWFRAVCAGNASAGHIGRAFFAPVTILQHDGRSTPRQSRGLRGLEDEPSLLSREPAETGCPTRSSASVGSRPRLSPPGRYGQFQCETDTHLATAKAEPPCHSVSQTVTERGFSRARADSPATQLVRPRGAH